MLLKECEKIAWFWNINLEKSCCFNFFWMLSNSTNNHEFAPGDGLLFALHSYRVTSKGRGPRRRCSAKKILRNGNLVGKIFIFKDFGGDLIPLLFDFFSFGEAGWIGRETEGDWKRPCPLLANRYPLAKLIAAAEKKPLLSSLQSL